MSTAQRGFTLLEMLVAIAIFALVAIMAHGGLRSVLQQRSHVEQQSEALQQLQMAMLLIGRDLTQASLRGIRDEYGDHQSALRGDSLGERRLEFTRDGWRNPAAQPRSELQRVAYGLQDQQLLRWSWQVLDRAQDSQAYQASLLSGVEELQLRYLDAQREWQDHWPPSQGDGQIQPILPLAIEMRLGLQGQGEIRRLFVLPQPPQGQLLQHEARP